MIGLSGFEFTSRTGAKFMCTPTARASSAVIRANRSTSASVPTAPKAIVGGKLVPPPWPRRLGSA